MVSQTASAAVPDTAARHRAIFESAVDFAIIATDVDGVVTDWNPGAESIFGWTASERVGQPADIIWTPEDRARDQVGHEMRSALAVGRASDERWHLRQDHSRFWASGELMPLRAPDGAHLGFVKILRDRTRAHEAAAAQAADAEFMRSVLASSNDCIKVLDLDARLEFMSEGGQKVMEVSDFNQLRGCAWPSLWEGSARDDVLTALEAARAGGVGRFQGLADTMAGNARYWDVQVTPILGADGKPQRLLSISRDITQQKRSELAVQQLAQTLERRVEERTRERDRAWKHSSDLQLVMDTQGRVHAVNDAWTTLLGWTAEELVGRPFSDFLVPADLPRGAADAHALAAAHALPSFENRYLHKDGRKLSFAWVSAPHEGLIYASGRNVTAEKEAAASLAIVHEQLRQSQKMEAVGQLTGGLAHDFNNLLASISGSLELMARRLKQNRFTEFERYIGVAQASTQRAASLTHRMLAFSRRQTLEPKAIDANKLVAGMEDLVRRTIGPAVALKVVAAPALWALNIDPHQLENALLNLCINARDAMPHGGRLTIETANQWLDERAAAERQLKPGPYVSLYVADTGTGMDSALVQRIFEPFFTTKPIGLGTGLGLSMVYGFAVQSGGQVRVYSEVGLGTTMCLYLPRHDGDATDAQATTPASADADGTGRGTVLVVDDEATVRAIVVEALADLGYATLEAEDGARGLDVLRTVAAIDLLVTDVGLPGGMNGRQLADAGRELHPGLKVLFITGYAENAFVGDGDLAPGMQVLTKPFNLDALAVRVTGLLATDPER